MRRAAGGGGFAHFDDWGVLTTYDAGGVAVEHAVVAWPAAVAYYERLADWDAFGATGHVAELRARNLTDDAHARIRQARAEKLAQGETPWPAVPFECRSQHPASPSAAGRTQAGSEPERSTEPGGVESATPGSSTTSSSTASSSASQARRSESADRASPTSRRLKPSVPPQAHRHVQLWCLNTPCTRDSECASQGCGTCVMRDKFLFLSCSG